MFLADATFSIVGENLSIERMMVAAGAEKVSPMSKAEIIIFTGGADVTPSFYGHTKHAATGSNLMRDIYEQAVFKRFKGAFKIGICRGAQFLHVMNGGTMYQHVDGHTRPHPAFFDEGGVKRMVTVTSTHHQMMYPQKRKGVIMMYAGESSEKQSHSKDMLITERPNKKYLSDAECIWYKDTQSFCYQPHPEYNDSGPGCRYAFFHLLERALTDAGLSFGV